MPTIERFEEIEAWKQARELTKLVYKMTSRGAWAMDFALRDQIRRAVISVMCNIAEGFERGGPAEFSRYLTIAKASAAEVRCQLYIALDLEYLDRQAFSAACETVERTARMISGLMTYLKSANRRRPSPPV